MIFSYYNEQTGLFTGRKLRARSVEDAELNCPEHESFVPGDIDANSHKVSDGKVVKYKPPQPDDRYKWVGGKWILKAKHQRAENQSARARRDIKTLETRQLRPLRELAIDPNNQEAITRLAEIEAEIGRLRLLLI